MKAVDAAAGAPQEYFEVNAAPQLVNLFVAQGDGAAVAYVYLPDSGLGAPAPPQTASGPTFAAADVSFAGTVLDQVIAELPTSTPTGFVVSAAPDGAIEYRAYFRSAKGGQIAVLLGADGAVLSTQTS